MARAAFAGDHAAVARAYYEWRSYMSDAKLRARKLTRSITGTFLAFKDLNEGDASTILTLSVVKGRRLVNNDFRIANTFYLTLDGITLPFYALKLGDKVDLYGTEPYRKIVARSWNWIP